MLYEGLGVLFSIMVLSHAALYTAAWSCIVAQHVVFLTCLQVDKYTAQSLRS